MPSDPAAPGLLWLAPGEISGGTEPVAVSPIDIAFGETIALKKRYGIRFGELETVFGLEDDGG